MVTIQFCLFEMKTIIVHLICLISFTIPSAMNLSAQHAGSRKHISDKSPMYKKLSSVTASSRWKQISVTPLLFPTYHTQGITKVNDFFYMTAVKVTRWPKHFNKIINGFDRDNGEGIGYLFRFDSEGNLSDSIRLGEGVIYHPGGIDYDGNYIWVPVCEYRPHGRSFIYRVDPKTMNKTKMGECNDALGAVAYNRDNNTLVGMNWGSREFYQWKVIQKDNATRLQSLSEQGTTNPHCYIDYQDCNFIGNGLMLCSGLKTYKSPDNNSSLRLGGIEVIDMHNYASRLSLPVNEWSERGAIMTNNPCFADLVNGKLRFYFVPDDDHSVLYTYELE